MRRDRREFLTTAAGLVAGAFGAGCQCEGNGSVAVARTPATPARTATGAPPTWEWVRSQFRLAPNRTHLSALLMASHPAPVRDALDHYRRSLDLEPTLYLVDNNPRLRRNTLEAAAEYLGGDADEVALTDSTTMGLGLVYNGIRLRRGQEVIYTAHGHYSSHEALRLAAERSGAAMRHIALYERLDAVTSAEIVDRIVDAITPRTRVLALTWVHSSTGLKLPVARITQEVRATERRLGMDEPILVCLDAVHGFGVEDVEAPDLDVDFFIAGCHKWLFGPRGTGVVWGPSSAWEQTLPTIPSFMESEVHRAWLEGEEPQGPTTAHAMAPGGFKAFEYQWALAEAFAFHQNIGKARIAERTRELARSCKEGLAAMSHVQLHTPLFDDLSSGIVCCQLDHVDPWTAAVRLADKGVVASVAPYATRHLRFTPCIYNSHEDIENALRAMREIR
jgi:isopenicillin-N epimerase